MRGSGGWPRESRGRSGPSGFAAEAAFIADQFRLQMIGLRQRFQAWEIPAVMRMLRAQRDMAMLALREKHARMRFAERNAERAARQARQTPS